MPRRRTRMRPSAAGRAAAAPWKNDPMTGEDTQPGQPFDGRYRVLGRLGVGGMATVYLAEDSSLGRKVALKVMAERYAEDGEFVERFRREAQAAARLNHPNIIAVYDRGEADGRPYIAMEYLQGRTLKQVIQKEGPLPPERAIAIAMQVLAGLRYAHEHGVVHRDVKPHNVLVGDDGRIKVTDFGIAHAGDPQMTEVGSIVGTAQYLSPEQARGRSVGPQTDIYSLGVVLYEMLAGRVPFEGDSSVAIAMQHVSDEPPPLRALAPDVPESLAMVVAHAMLKEPGAALRQRRRVRRRPRPRPARPRAGRGDGADRDAAARADRAGARGRGHAHRARRPRRPSLLSGEKLPPRPDAAQALALAVAARPAAAARGRRARGVRARRRARATTRRRRPDAARRRPRTTTTAVTTHVLEDLDGQDVSARPARRCAAIGSSRRRSGASACATPRTRPTSWSRAMPPAGRASCSRRHRAAQGLARAEGDPEHRRHVRSADARAAARRRLQIVRRSPRRATSSTRARSRAPTRPRRQRMPVGSTRDDLRSRPAPPRCRCRNLTGKTEDEARATLSGGRPDRARAAGEPLLGRRRGRVRSRSRSPSRARSCSKGTAISFDLANSPCTVDVPNVPQAPGRPGRAEPPGERSVAQHQASSPRR